MIHAKMYQFKRRWKIVTINKPTSKIKFALFVEKRQEKILSYFVSIPNSFNCAGSTGLGACAIKSDALAVLGNATTSRMLSVPAKIIVKRYRPIPTPP